MPDRLPIVWLDKACDQRARQLEFFLRHNPEMGIRIGDALAATVAQIATNPDLSRIGRIAGARELPVPGTPFVLVYRIEEDEVVILRVLQTASVSRRGRMRVSNPNPRNPVLHPAS